MSAHMNTLERAMLNVEPETNTGCWLWSGGVFQATGYGRLGFEGKTVQAHRFFYQQHRGSIPAGFFVLHRCDTPLCVNPAHLFIGTAAHNAADCAAKGRQNPPRGAEHGMAKLSAADVAEIRRLADERKIPQWQIGERFGVSQANVSMIRRRRTWAAARHDVKLSATEADPNVDAPAAEGVGA